MSLHERPLCFDCVKPVEYDPIYAAPCDHQDCPSAVFHPLCLMRWRERRDEAFREFRRWLEKHALREDDSATE